MDFFTLKKMLKDRVICNRNKISFERERNGEGRKEGEKEKRRKEGLKSQE